MRTSPSTNAAPARPGRLSVFRPHVTLFALGSLAAAGPAGAETTILRTPDGRTEARVLHEGNRDIVQTPDGRTIRIDTHNTDGSVVSRTPDGRLLGTARTVR